MRTLLRSCALALVCVLLAAGCGGEEREPAPKLPSGLAESLADRSDTVASRLDAGDACAARTEADALQRDAIAAVNEQRVPAALQEELLGAATALAAAIRCEPAAAPAGEDAEEDDEGNGKGKKGKGKGKKKGKGK